MLTVGFVAADSTFIRYFFGKWEDHARQQSGEHANLWKIRLRGLYPHHFLCIFSWRNRSRKLRKEKIHGEYTPQSFITGFFPHWKTCGRGKMYGMNMYITAVVGKKRVETRDAMPRGNINGKKALMVVVVKKIGMLILLLWCSRNECCFTDTS